MVVAFSFVFIYLYIYLFIVFVLFCFYVNFSFLTCKYLKQNKIYQKKKKKKSVLEYTSWRLLLMWISLHYHLVNFLFPNYFWKWFYHNWVANNSLYNSLTRIWWIPCFDVFQQKYLSAIVNISYKSFEIIHKPPLDNAEFNFWFSHSWIPLQISKILKINWIVVLLQLLEFLVFLYSWSMIYPQMYCRP